MNDSALIMRSDGDLESTDSVLPSDSMSCSKDKEILSQNIKRRYLL
jgi:hypothetical protein